MGYKLVITEFDVNDQDGADRHRAARPDGRRLRQSLSRPDAELSAAPRHARWGMVDRYSWLNGFDPRADKTIPSAARPTTRISGPKPLRGESRPRSPQPPFMQVGGINSEEKCHEVSIPLVFGFDRCRSRHGLHGILNRRNRRTASANRCIIRDQIVGRGLRRAECGRVRCSGRHTYLNQLATGVQEHRTAHGPPLSWPSQADGDPGMLCAGDRVKIFDPVEVKATGLEATHIASSAISPSRARRKAPTNNLVARSG